MFNALWVISLYPEEDVKGYTKIVVHDTINLVNR